MDNHDGKSAVAQPEDIVEHGIPLTAAVKARVEDLEQRRIELLQKVLKNQPLQGLLLGSDAKDVGFQPSLSSS